VSSDRTTVATDGSCLGNPGPGGWAWATADGRQDSGGVANTTNNVMELRALREALAAFPASTPLLLQVDSQYVIKTFTEWIEGWKARGWRTSDKRPVKNRAEIEPIDALLRGRDVRWEHVRGHAGHPLNERVDLLAHAAAIAARSGAGADTFRRGSPTMTSTEGAITPCPVAWCDEAGAHRWRSRGGSTWSRVCYHDTAAGIGAQYTEDVVADGVDVTGPRVLIAGPWIVPDTQGGHIELNSAEEARAFIDAVRRAAAAAFGGSPVTPHVPPEGIGRLSAL
jgi:ribonuclease HI